TVDGCDARREEAKGQAPCRMTSIPDCKAAQPPRAQKDREQDRPAVAPVDARGIAHGQQPCHRGDENAAIAQCWQVDGSPGIPPNPRFMCDCMVILAAPPGVRESIEPLPGEGCGNRKGTADAKHAAPVTRVIETNGCGLPGECEQHGSHGPNAAWIAQ